MSLYLGTTPIANNSVSRNIGEIIQSTIPLSDAGLHLLDGALINGAGSYAKFVTYIAGLVTDYPNLFTTEANWQTAVTTYGVCGKFVYDSVNNTVRLPKITGFVEGTVDATALGDLVEAGLPNITGAINGVSPYGQNYSESGSYYWLVKNYNYPAQLVNNTNFNYGAGLRFDASRSSSIYGNSSTVQPQSIKVLYYIVIASSITNELSLDVSDMATKSLDNLDNTGKNIANWSNNVTNCITEIPQDIKLELTGSGIALKGGSKITFPDGTQYQIQNDKPLSNGWGSVGEKQFLFVKPDYMLMAYRMQYTYSGDTAPSVFHSGKYAMWLDTTNRQVKWTEDGGTTWTGGYSLPIAIVEESVTEGLIDKIDQVFNGFGYIGSTVFALPGVKGLIPNGRNADGTLNNIEASVSSVSLLTLQSSITVNGNGRFLLNTSGKILARVGSYDENNNYVLGGNGIEKIYGCVFADNCTVTSGVIKTLNTKTAFHAVDYNDSSWVAQQAMPSSRYINLTLGASGSTYTAPANGWVYLRKSITSVGQFIVCTQGPSQSVGWGVVANNQAYVLHPVHKGTFVVAYNAGGTTVNDFRFIYAEGEQ